MARRRRRVMKKSMTPIGRRGRIDTHEGKGAQEQRTMPGERESLTGGDPFARGAETYPKLPPERPEGMGPRPTAMMPAPIGKDVLPEERE